MNSLKLNRIFLAGLCALPLTLLLGCPSDDTTGNEEIGSETTGPADTGTAGDGDGDGDGDGTPGDGDGTPGDGDGTPGDGDGAPAPYCGDGLIDPGEECEGPDLGGMDCAMLGFLGGELACGMDCMFDTSACTSAVCGDGVAEGSETCDGDDYLGEDCTTLGYDGGVLACGMDCMADTSGCYVQTCGNDAIEGMETCDGIDLAGQTCVDQGFVDGELACLMDCMGFDTSLCGTCGNDLIDGADVCDGADVGGQTCADLGHLGGTLACSLTCDALDESACQDSWWSDDFESGNVFKPEWVLGGNVDPFVSQVMPHAGIYNAENGNIGDSQTSYMEVNLDFAMDGSVSFWRRVSTEGGWDFLRFYVDNVQIAQWSGVIGWTMSTYPITAGPHTLRWTYFKDSSVSSGADSVWVDDIATVGGLLP